MLSSFKLAEATQGREFGYRSMSLEHSSPSALLDERAEIVQ